MADDDKRKFEIPWATLLPLLAALAGVIAQFRPLVSARPGIPSEKPIEVIAVQDVDARLWQDPLAVAQKAKAQLEAETLVRDVPQKRVERHQIDALKKKVVDAATVAGEKVLLLAVMLDSGPYIEQGESRLRARQAVLEGLNESGFVPMDSEHIGFVTNPGEMSPVWRGKEPGKTIEDGAVLIPWEECKADESRRIYPEGTKRAFILWLPASSFNSRPLESFAALVRPFAEAATDNIDIKLLGPANSTGLRSMVAEARTPSEARDPACYDLLDGVEIISPLATAPDKALDAPNEDLPRIIEESVTKRDRGGLRFRRTIKTDDYVLEHLIAELKLRQVNVAPRQEGNHWVDGDRVVILTEWDNPYGRSLASTFGEKASPDEKHPASISFYRYMHGIDGRLPGDPARSRDDSQKSAPSQGAPVVEATEGLDQSDFLRRLSRQLRDEDTRLWRDGKGGIRAIGLLGSDIFDKLMILRALRPEFRDAIFFTNNFDAHFERRDDWSDVRNLVVASPFGSILSNIEQPGGLPAFVQQVAPFRDNNQTAMFFGTLVATGRFDHSTLLAELARQPRLFEIGRHGAHELSQNRWFADWLRRFRWNLGAAAFALSCIGLWITLSVVDRRRLGGGTLRDRGQRLVSSTAFWLLFLAPIIVVSVAWYSEQGDAALEPLAFFSGISIWPSEMLRLVAFVLAIHFMIKAHFDLRANEREITRRFFSDDLPSQKWHWRLGLRRWQTEHGEWLFEETHFSAKEAWIAYLQRNHWWPRCVRVGALFIIYAILALGVSSLSATPVIPARGPIAFVFDHRVLYPTVIAMMLLTFYVVDALRLNSNFIRIFTRGVTEWDPHFSRTAGRTPPLTRSELSRYHDIFFVAQRTEAVAPLIWYPLIVLTLLLIARSPYFDHWTWPFGLVLIFTLNAMWALGSAIYLRRSAEQLRSASISNLQLLRVKKYSRPEKRQMFDELIAEVRSVKKGAFAPLTEQPFIRAIIYPSGGLGLLAVGQRLLDFF